MKNKYKNLTNTHVDKTFVPSFDDLADPKLECEWLIAIETEKKNLIEVYEL